jgi:hypothetical protein
LKQLSRQEPKLRGSALLPYVTFNQNADIGKGTAIAILAGRIGCIGNPEIMDE